MTLFELQTLHNHLCRGLEEQFLAAGLVYHLDQCARTDEQAVINSYGSEGRHGLAVLIQHGYPALALALANNGKEKSPLMTVHRYGLARDYNLFRNGLYLQATEDHRAFGTWWKEQHELARWGGDFGDGNHYSVAYMGVK